MVCSFKSLALLALAVASVSTPALAQLDPASVAFAANAAAPSTPEHDPVESTPDQAPPSEADEGMNAVVSDSVSNVVTETKVDAPDVEPETPEIEAGWRPVGQNGAPAAPTPVDEPTPSPDEGPTPAPVPESSASGAVPRATALVVVASVAITGFFI
ncbi:unnamed protein product [Hyaloperonospora brassicae]|uniref:RxLR effector candidate protein n=1 Tax=Hyaloperonospora brassicae TaxID=162125 RepID=A0AAV0TDE5_HYABA|nr:unnamed protein product [Hyaloperonospora brassicae]